MTQYEQFLTLACQRSKSLEAYETFVYEKLSLYQDTSSAQIHDWLKEHHPDFPDITPRMVYNFVIFVRQKHNIPVVSRCREFFPVEELPYGEQSKVAFGQYNMQISNNKRQKNNFFCNGNIQKQNEIRFFLYKPFTAQTVVFAHEKVFEFFAGIPQTVG